MAIMTISNDKIININIKIISTIPDNYQIENESNVFEKFYREQFLYVVECHCKLC